MTNSFMGLAPSPTPAHSHENAGPTSTCKKRYPLLRLSVSWEHPSSERGATPPWADRRIGSFQGAPRCARAENRTRTEAANAQASGRCGEGKEGTRRKPSRRRRRSRRCCSSLLRSQNHFEPNRRSDNKARKGPSVRDRVSYRSVARTSSSSKDGVGRSGIRKLLR